MLETDIDALARALLECLQVAVGRLGWEGVGRERRGGGQGMEEGRRGVTEGARGG